MARHEGIGYILHRRAYRETSLLLEVLCEEHGRLGLVARGRAARQPDGSALRPFTRLRLSWSGRGELGTLGRFEPAGVVSLRREVLMFGLYLNELVQRSVPRLADIPEIFRLYEGALRGLGRTDNPWAVMLQFQRDLLRALGYGLQLDTTADGGLEIDPDRVYRYRADAGPVSASVGGEGSLVSGRVLVALRGDVFDDRELRRQAVALMDDLFGALLGGRSVNARRLLPTV